MSSIRGDDLDRAVHEHEMLCSALKPAGSFIQLGLGALASFEIISRRLQLIEESKATGGAAAYEGAKYYL
eukprot:2692592-Karenia_brevis.AAC.1